MKMRGWKDLPANYQYEFNFHRGPKWLLALAHTPYFDRYAYPKAIELGLAEAWPIQDGIVIDPSFDRKGWVIHNSPKDNFEKWIEGSMGFLTPRKKYSTIRFLLKRRSLYISSNRVIFWHVLPRISFTRYGAHRKFQADIHRLNGTYKNYRKALRGERFDFSE
jgi:hypothetical protein